MQVVPWSDAAARPHPDALICAHCSNPVPAREARVAGAPAFCCAGCRTVFQILHDSGLSGYYERRRGLGVTPRPVPDSGRRFDELDDPELARTVQRALADGSRSVELFLEGVHCPACVWLVERLPRVAPGVCEARLDFTRSLARVRFRPDQTSLGAVARALDRLGYTPHLAGTSESDRRTRGERDLVVRTGVAGAVAGNVMLMALALYSGAGSAGDEGLRSLFRWASLLVLLPSVLYAAVPFYRGALSALRTRTPHMDLPVTLGILVGFAAGAFNTFRGRGEIYFDSVAMLIFLLLVGRLLQRKKQLEAAGAADFVLALAPSNACVLTDGRSRDVHVASLSRGDLLVVKRGQRIPVDGRLERGQGSVDLSLLTGESAPQTVRAGDRVYAGTTNLDAEIVVATELVGESTRLGKLGAAIREAASERAPVVRLADRVAGWFVGVVIALALLTLAWHLPGDPAGGVSRAVALLIVTCPCALAIATPLAVSVALYRAAQRGLLFKTGDALEALARNPLLLFDKTGTLTEGRPELVSWDGSDELARRVSVAEAPSEHPIARAFRRAFPPSDGEPAGDAQVVAGGGVRAVVQGGEILAGSPELLESRGVVVPDHARQALDDAARAGLTPVLVAEKGSYRAMAAFGDELRPDTRESLRSLARSGHELVVLSGDHQRVVFRVCGDLPLVEARGGMSPEQKLGYVSECLSRNRPVVMIGDGVNDAAAMAKATVGIAVHGGAEASLLAADAFFSRGGVGPLVEAIAGAQETLSVIRRSIAFSIAYNLVGVSLALTGQVTPLLAAVLMPLSSLSVVTLALNSRAFRGAVHRPAPDGDPNPADGVRSATRGSARGELRPSFGP